MAIKSKVNARKIEFKVSLPHVRPDYKFSERSFLQTNFVLLAMKCQSRYLFACVIAENVRATGFQDVKRNEQNHSPKLEQNICGGSTPPIMSLELLLI